MSSRLPSVRQRRSPKERLASDLPRGFLPVTRPPGLTHPPGPDRPCERRATALVNPRTTSVRNPMVRGIAAGSERQESVAVLLTPVDDLGHRVNGGGVDVVAEDY